MQKTKNSGLSEEDVRDSQDTALDIKNTIAEWYSHGAKVNAISKSIENLQDGIKLLEALIPFPADLSKITFQVKNEDLTQINELARILQGRCCWRVEVLDSGELTFEDNKLLVKYFTGSELKEIFTSFGGQLEDMQIEIKSCISLARDLEILQMIFKLNKCDLSQSDGIVFRCNQNELFFKGCFVTPESAVEVLELIIQNQKNSHLLNAHTSVVKYTFQEGYGVLAQAAKMKVKYLKFDNILETSYQETAQLVASDGAVITNEMPEISPAKEEGSSIEITNTLKILIDYLDLGSIINITKSRGDTLTNLEIIHSEQLCSDSIREYLDSLPFNMKSASITSQTASKQGVNFAFDSNSIVSFSGIKYFNHFKIDSYSSNAIVTINVTSKCTEIGDISFALQFLKRLLFLLPKQKHLQKFLFGIIHPVECKDYSCCVGKQEELFEVLASHACFLMNSVQNIIRIKETQLKEEKKSNNLEETILEIDWRYNEPLRVILGEDASKIQRSIVERIICQLKFEKLFLKMVSVKKALYLVENLAASRFSKLKLLSLTLSGITPESVVFINKLLLMQMSKKTDIMSDFEHQNYKSELFIQTDLSTRHFKIYPKKEYTKILHEFSAITHYLTLTLGGQALSQDSFNKLANVFVENSISENLESKDKKTIIFMAEMGPRRTATVMKICHQLHIKAKVQSNYYFKCDVSTFHQFSKLYSRPFKLFSDYRTTSTLVSADFTLFGCFNLKFNENNLYLHFQSDVGVTFNNMVRIIQQAVEVFPGLKVLKISTTGWHSLTKQQALTLINLAIMRRTLFHIGFFRDDYLQIEYRKDDYSSAVLDYFYQKRTLLRTLSAVSKLGFNRIEKLQEFYEFFPSSRCNPQLPKEIEFSFDSA